MSSAIPTKFRSWTIGSQKNKQKQTDIWFLIHSLRYHNEIQWNWAR